MEYQKQQAQQPQKKYGILFGPDGKNYMVPIGEDGKLLIPESIKKRYPDADSKPTNSDLLRGASNMGQGQMGEPPMDKHNGLDYRNVGGKDHQGPAPESARPTNPLEAEKQRKRDEIMKQREYEAQLAAKRGHSL